MKRDVVFLGPTGGHGRLCCLSENLCVCVSYVDVFEERGPSSAKVRMDGMTSIDCGFVSASTCNTYRTCTIHMQAARA